MTVKELIDHLTQFPENANVVLYTKCGPDSVRKVTFNGCGEVALDGGEACPHIVDGACPSTLPAQANSDGTARTNTPKRVDFVICTNKVENTIIALDAEAKVTRDVKDKASKAYKKDQKTFENWIKDTKKAMNKSSTQEMKDFFQSVLDLAGSVSQ